MKKFLSKMPVMLVFVVLAVALLGVYVGLLARPVATGMNYSYTVGTDDNLKDMEGEFDDVTIFSKFNTTTNITFTSSKKAVLTTSFDYAFKKDADKAKTDAAKELIEATEKEAAEGMEVYYYRVGNKVYILVGATEKTYDDTVKTLKAIPGWEKNYVLTVNAFNLKANTEGMLNTYEKPFVCTGTIVLASVLGVVEVVLLVFAGMSVAYFVQSKKKA